MHCQTEGPNYNLCIYDPKSRAGGCDVSGTPAPLVPVALLLVFGFLIRRRFSISN
jgi:MYXO-CTERM domain-containing protein